MTYDMTIEARVQRGAAWLDMHEPDWLHSVDLDVLDMGDGRYCILGQIYGGELPFRADYSPYLRGLDNILDTIHDGTCPSPPPADIDSDYWLGFEAWPIDDDEDNRYEAKGSKALEAAWRDLILIRVLARNLI